MSGHFHHKSDDGQIFYLGTPYEIYWNDYDDPKGFHIFDTETRQLDRVINPLTIFDKIYYDDTTTNYENVNVEKYKHKFIKVIVVNKKDLYQFDRFIDKLLKIDTHEVKIIEDFTDLDANSVSDDIVENSEDTITLLNKYVDELPVDLNKNRLKNEIRTLYTEAPRLRYMIIFKSVKWKNFLSTGNTFTTIYLDRQPTTLIVGDNGAGKSTILDALCFVLFNKPFRVLRKHNLLIQ